MSSAENFLKLKVIRECVVLLSDVKFNENIKFIDDATAFLKEGRKKYACYVCMLKFLTESDLDSHKSSHDENDADLVTRDDEKDSDYSGNDSEETESESEYDFTILPHNSNENQTSCSLFSCTTCRVTFRTLSDLRTHVLMPEKCIFSCKLCVRTFNSSDVFLGHIVHHRINFLSLKFFMCDICGQCFENYFQLRKHEVVSHNLKPWTDKDKLPPLSDKYSDPKDAKDVLDVQIVPKDEPADQDLSEAAGNTTMISCELCFDLCNSDEEFATHMEFHRQLAIKDSEDSEIVHDKCDTRTVDSEVKPKLAIRKNCTDLTPRAKLIHKVPQKITLKMVSKLVPILPKPNKQSETNATANFSIKSKSSDMNNFIPNSTVLTAANKEQTSTIFVKNILELKNKSLDKAEAYNKVASSSSSVAIKQFDPSSVSTKRLILKKEFSGPSGKWILTEKDSTLVKNYLQQESTLTNNINTAKTTNTSSTIIMNVSTTTTTAKENISSITVSSPSVIKNVQSQRTGISGPLITKINTPQISKNFQAISTSGALKVVSIKKPITPKVPISAGTQTVRADSSKRNLVIPNVVTVPPAPNSGINVAQTNKQIVGNIPNNWTNPQNTNATNSNLLYVINPVNNFGVSSEPQMTYLNDTSNFTYFLVPSNPSENVANVNFASQTSVIQNPYSVPEGNKVLYTLPTIDPSLNIVPQGGTSHLSNAVSMPMLSSDNNLYFITNQSNNSVQGNMQSTGVINTIVTQNSLQPNSSVGGGFFTQN